MAPMGTCLDEGGHITDDTIAYYRRRAEGGVGTITVEGCLVSRRHDRPGAEHQRPGVPAGAEEAGRRAAGLRRHRRRAAHAPGPPGRRRPDRRALAGAAELARADPARADACRDRADRRRLRARRRAGAARPASTSSRSTARTATCRRTSSRRSTTAAPTTTAARWRTARASASRSRARSSTPALPLVWRINGDDGIDGRLRARRVRAGLAVAGGGGRAAISVSAGTWHTLHVTLAPMFVPRGHMRHLAAAVKAAVDVPVIAVGRLDDPALAAADRDRVRRCRPRPARPRADRRARLAAQGGRRTASTSCGRASPATPAWTSSAAASAPAARSTPRRGAS